MKLSCFTHLPGTTISWKSMRASAACMGSVGQERKRSDGRRSQAECQIQKDAELNIDNATVAAGHVQSANGSDRFFARPASRRHPPALSSQDAPGGFV